MSLWGLTDFRLSSKPPLAATKAELNLLTARVAALEARLRDLEAPTKKCPVCGASHIARRIYVPTSQPEQWWDCQECKHYWVEVR